MGFERRFGVLKKYNEQPKVIKTVIPNGVKVIGYKAFFNNENLVEVVIPNSVITIGVGAFQDCLRLKNIVIPGSVIEILDSAFKGCLSLRNVVIPNSVVKIESSVFENCESLEDINTYSYDTFNMLDKASQIIAISSFAKNYLTKRINYSKEDIKKFKKYIKLNQQQLLKNILNKPYLMYFILNEMNNFITNDNIIYILNNIETNVDIKSLMFLKEYIEKNHDFQKIKQM